MIKNERIEKAEQFIKTATGPVAKLSDGKWYSVNGSGPNDIMDIRYEIDLSVSWRGTPAEREAVQKAMVDAKTAELEHKTSTPDYRQRDRQRDEQQTRKHRAKYAELADKLGLPELTELVYRIINVDRLPQMIAEDQHLNQFGNGPWDRQHFRTQALASAAGIKHWTLSDNICTLKEVARQAAERISAPSSAPLHTAGAYEGDWLKRHNDSIDRAPVTEQEFNQAIEDSAQIEKKIGAERVQNIYDSVARRAPNGAPNRADDEAPNGARVMNNWACTECGHEVIAREQPEPIKWSDGHACSFLLMR